MPCVPGISYQIWSKIEEYAFSVDILTYERSLDTLEDRPRDTSASLSIARLLDSAGLGPDDEEYRTRDCPVAFEENRVVKKWGLLDQYGIISITVACFRFMFRTIVFHNRKSGNVQRRPCSHLCNRTSVSTDLGAHLPGKVFWSLCILLVH